METNTALSLAAFAAKTQFDELPPAVVHEAKRILFDVIGCALGSNTVAKGRHAIEFARVHVKVDEDGQPVPGSGFLAPVVLADKCVGCGLCQTRCNLINVKAKHLLKETAIRVEAGPGRVTPSHGDALQSAR